MIGALVVVKVCAKLSQKGVEWEQWCDDGGDPKTSTPCREGPYPSAAADEPDAFALIGASPEVSKRASVTSAEDSSSVQQVDSTESTD